MFKIKIKLESLLYNNDNEAIEYLKFKNIPVDEFDKEIKKDIVNEIELEVRDDYSIDYLLKKLSRTLMDKIDVQHTKKTKKELKTCVYCFADRDLKNPENQNEIIIMDKNIKINKISKQKDIDDIDIEEDDVSEIDFDEEELSDIDMGDLSDVENIEGGGMNGGKILLCKNCKKAYFYNKYFDWVKYQENYENFSDIFPFPELIYLRNKKKKLTFNLIDSQRKEIPYQLNEQDMMSPYNNIKEIEKKFFLKEKKNQLFKYLDSISLNDGKEYKYIYNTSYMLLKNFEYNDLTMTYFPELCLYKKNNQYKSLEIYSKLYYPNINFANYYLKFLDNIPKEEYVEVSLRKIQINKRKINDSLDIYSIDQIMSEKYGKDEIYSGWGVDIENKELIDQKIEKINHNKIKITKYINKINYKINSSRETNSLINFSLIFHLFELNEETPFISSYLPEEGVMLEKYYRPVKSEIEKLKLQIKNKKIIRFLTLLPKEIMGEKKYFYIHLYENLKIEVTISISNQNKVYINQENLLKINNIVNKLISKLNNLNIFNFSNTKIPLSNTDFKKWNKKNEETNINSINLNFEIENKMIDEIHYKINNISKCFNNYFIRDYNYDNNDYRYIKINNINLGVLTDRFIYYKLQNIKELDSTNTKTDEEIEEIIIFSIMSDFQKNYFESKNIYKNYNSRYRNLDNNIVPINYGVFFNIKKVNVEDDKDNKYLVNVFGLRDYNDINNIEKFIGKLFYILNNPEEKNISEIYDICQIINQKNINDIKIISKQNLILLNQKYRKCNIDYNVLYNNNKKLKKTDKAQMKKIKEQMKKIKDTKKKLYKKIVKKESTTKHVKALKQLQNVFSNLKYNSCSDKNIKQYTKRCQAQKQPMGTGPGVYEEVIDWNKEGERNRMKRLDDITCSIEDVQLGAGKHDDLGKFTYKLYCDSWNYKYQELRKTYYDCYLEVTSHKGKGKKKIQKIASEYFEIDSEQKQISVVLELIYQKIIDNVVNETNYNSYLKKIESVDNKFLNEYYKNDLLQTYVIDPTEFSKYLYNKPLGKYEIFKSIIDSLDLENTSDMRKVLLSIMNRFNLQKIFETAQNRSINKIPMNELYTYIINKIFKIKKIKLTELIKIFKYLKKDISGYNHDITTLNQIFQMSIQQFYDTYLIHNDFNNTEDTEEENEEKENKTDETSLKELMSEVKDFVIRKDENNHIIDSVINYKGKALTCPNYSEGSIVKPLIGFLDISKFSNKDNLQDNEIRDLVCQPCCFGQKYNEATDDHIIDKRYRKNMLFCKSKIDWSSYLKLIENETRIDGYIYSEALNINTTFGMLCKPLYNLFNNFVFLSNQRHNLELDSFLFKDYTTSNRVLKNYGFCKKGYDQKKNVILTILEDILEIKKKNIISNIIKKINSNPEIFKILNEGKLFILFKSIDNYINYLKSDSVDINWIVDILKYPGIFKKYPEGINILLFKKVNEEDENSDIQIMKYKFLDMIDYYDLSKNIIFLYKHDSGEIEPIILKKKKLQLGIFKQNMHDLDIFKNIEKKYNIDIDSYFADFLLIFNDWIKIIFKNNYFSAKKLIKKFNNIKIQLIDKFYKVNYLIDNENNLIPVIPSEVDINLKFEIFDNVDYFTKNKYLKNLDDTIAFIKQIRHKLNDEFYLFQKIILDEDKKYIVGIELRNNLIIPIIPQKHNNSTFRISSKFLYFNINNVLFNNETIDEEIKFIKEKYDLEIYQRFILEFSNYLDSNQNEVLILNENINTDKKLFSEKILDIVDKIITFKEAELINYKKINTQTNNLRVLCKTDQNFYCDKNRLIIPYSKKNFLIGLFIESILNNEDFRLKVFNNNMTNIIDINKYIDDKNHVFNKKEFTF
jgi:hypothetical protein